jgi:hypothetical protein
LDDFTWTNNIYTDEIKMYQKVQKFFNATSTEEWANLTEGRSTRAEGFYSKRQRAALRHAQ